MLAHCYSTFSSPSFFFFFFNDTATTEIYTLSLHDALPIFRQTDVGQRVGWVLVDRLLVVGDRLVERLGVPLFPEIPAFQVQVVRLLARRRGLDAAAQQLVPQRLRDGARDLVLQGEDALQLAVVALRPEVVAVAHLDELRRHA